MFGGSKCRWGSFFGVGPKPSAKYDILREIGEKAVLAINLNLLDPPTPEGGLIN